MLPSFENVPPPLLSDILVRKRSFLFNNEKGNAANVSNFNITAVSVCLVEGDNVTVELMMEAENQGDITTSIIVAEIAGSEFPNEVTNIL